LTFWRRPARIGAVKLVIVGGAGGVGASAAFNVLALGGDHDVVIVDRVPEMVASHVMDLEQTLVLGASRSIRAGDLGDLADADVVVCTVGAPLHVNTSRLAYLNANAAIVRDVVDVLPVGWGGVLVMVSNPVDPLCAWVQKRIAIDRRRLVGYTLNDTLRLRTGVALALDVAPASVEAWVIGEHGDACVALWDRVRVDGDPVELDSDQREAAEAFLRGWYVRHVALDSGRSSTWTSGLGIARLVDAIGRDAKLLTVASVVLDGEYGFDDVALTVPVQLGRSGVRAILEWELTAEQDDALERAAVLVRDVAGRIDAASVVP
jgi:malate dehydrogenase